MRTKLYAGVAIATLMMPAAAFAQTTGSIEFEEGTEVVVTASADQEANTGFTAPDTTKSKVVVDQTFIERQRPGQTVNELINLVPGVSFQNNDATGAAGGTFTIRGFDSTRISQTIDGFQLNDSGNYAIYTNQQQDPETLDSINVNLGSTDVDSGTASASGGTVNIRTRVPSEEFGAMASGTVGTYAAEGSGAGDRMFYRAFAMVDTGDFTGLGTRAFASASIINGDNPFNNYGKLRKQQYNARIYQEIGSNGDFVSIAGHYNENRNNFFGSGPLRSDLTSFPNSTTPRVAGTGSGNRFPLTREERFYNIANACSIDTPQAGVADTTNSCGTEFDRRYNPSNTGNVRANTRLTLADGLVLTADGAYQYVKANGGGTVTGREGNTTFGGQQLFGYVGNNYYFGRDLNADGDVLDQVILISPSQTNTNRFGANVNLSYDITSEHRVRVAYTFDHARHRQTGEVGFVAPNGEPYDVFPRTGGNFGPITTGAGTIVQKRDRLSYATLHQVAGEYRGLFLDEALTVNLGLRAPFFTRELNQNCFTTSAGGFVDCPAGTPAAIAAYAAANPTYAAPQSRTYKYDKLLPNIGLIYNFTPEVSVFGNYSKNINVPGTDNLYNAFFFARTEDRAKPRPEIADSFDLGLRYNSDMVSAELSGWYTLFKDRIQSAYDPELDRSIFRNLGEVTKWGIDGSVSFRPVPDLLLYVFGSYLNSEIKDDLLAGNFDTDRNAATATVPVYYLTGGKREAGSPDYTFGGRIQYTLGPVDLGIQAKRTGKRYVNDENLPITQCFNAAGTGNGTLVGTTCFNGSTGTTAGTPTAVYGAAAPAYTLVDLDVRVNLADFGARQTYLQFNVNNLFDERYVGGFSGSGNRFSVPFVQFGVPRSISGSLVVGF